MVINKKEKFIEVVPDDGMILTDGNDYFEGLCCPLSVNPKELYHEITQEAWEQILINIKTMEENDNDRIGYNWGDN